MGTEAHGSRLPGILRLSPEIRRRIYLRVSLGPREVYYRGTVPRVYDLGGKDYDSYSTVQHPRPKRPVLFHGLLVSCRTIYTEASALLYSSNWFIYHYQNTQSLAPLRALRAGTIASLTNLRVILNQSSCHCNGPVNSEECCDYEWPYEIYYRRRDDSDNHGRHNYCAERHQSLHDPPIRGSDPSARKMLTEWHTTAAHLASHLNPGQLELSFVCDVHDQDVELAKSVVNALRPFPRLKDCHIRLSKTPDSRLRDLARDAVLQARGILLPSASASTKSPPGPRLITLPREVRLRILEYTDLIAPLKEVLWTRAHGKYLASRSTCDGASTSSSNRRRACDRCVRQKKACNSTLPCLNCDKRGVECHYSNPPPSPSQPAAPPPGLPPGLPPVADDAIHPGLDLDDTITHSHPGPSHPIPGGPVDSTFDHLPFGDLDTLIQQAVSQFPLLEGQPMHDAWFDVGFTPPNVTGAPGIEPSYQNEPIHSPPPPRYRGYSFRFLSDFTSRTGLVSSFECATLAQRQHIVAAFHQSYLEQPPPEFLGAIPSLAVLANPQEDSGLPQGFALADHRLSSWSSWLHNPIVVQLQQVVLLVKNVVTVKPNNSTITLTWSTALEQRCLQFFSPPRFAKFIELYWSVWHPNVNILHRPTFDTTNAKLILLASMALIGACVSPDSVDNEDARMWFNCVEEMVFTDDDFCRDIDPPVINDIASPLCTIANRRKLQALQAAYLVCLFQNWEGTDASKRRIRRHRFSTVVSIARDLGIDTARHLDYSRQPKHEFNWDEYVMREELIRIFIWIFLIDTAFVIFNNLPHRMVIKEMKMHMASPEVCFQAATAEECINQIHRWMPPTSPFCSLLLRDAIENLCLDTLTPEAQQRLSQLGPTNLFVMVSAIHYMIFQHQNLFAVEGQLAPIRNGLRNWIGIWEKYAELPSSLSPHGQLQEDCQSPELMWKRVGFVRFSHEYWLLGSLLTDRLSATTVTTPYQSSAYDTSPGLFQTTSSPHSKARSAEPILEKYDQTSMRQVNDLITDFQNFNIT
ncbi:hypothetical protein C8A00DRAFT_32498 [Chaetomidium leptoderma]|uniref:Zn(2)-C6 fungal-type domain-containing protein n=1 Tax=Chaetomidium leptoderma TaxID=669021 RepID=A0AAN6VN84_9PEZI|nr:hypothetical protein C8A00DRAFT_32498 [Chaetomidium leptoderma]